MRILDHRGGDLVLMLGGAHEKHAVEPGILLTTNNLLRAEENKRKIH